MDQQQVERSSLEEAFEVVNQDEEEAKVDTAKRAEEEDPQNEAQKEEEEEWPEGQEDWGDDHQRNVA